MNIKSKIVILITSVIFITSCVSTGETEKSGNKNLNSNEPIIAVNQDNNRNNTGNKEFIESLDKVFVKIVNAPKVATVGNNFVRPFTIQVHNKDGKPLADYPISIRYPFNKENGQVIYKIDHVNTDSKGMYEFDPGKLTFSGFGDFMVYPTPISNDEDVINKVTEKIASRPWDVKSDIASKGGILVVWDFKENDRFDDNSSEVLGELRSRGIYNVSNAPYSDSSFVNKSVEQIYKSNYEMVGGTSYGYLIYGTIKFDNPVTQTEAGSECSLTGNIQVLNMKDGSVKLAKTYKQTAVGNGWWDAVSKCKNKLAMKIVDSLLYDL